MNIIETRYKKYLEDVRQDTSLLHTYSVEAAIDTNKNQRSRLKLLIALYNYKTSGDYAIASYLFDEEIKAKHIFDTIDDYDDDILELAALILTSYGSINDILKMAINKPDQDGAWIDLDKEFILCYGKTDVLSFLENSIHPEKEAVSSKIAPYLDTYTTAKSTAFIADQHEYFEAFKFPIDSIAEFCLDTDEIDILEQEADRWFNDIKDWDDGDIYTGQQIAKLINNPDFTSRIKVIAKKRKAQLKEVREKKATIYKEDERASESNNTFLIFIVLLAFIGFTALSIVAAYISSEQVYTLQEQIGFCVGSLVLGIIAAFCLKGLSALNTNDLSHIKNTVLEDLRDPLVDWSYRRMEWHTFAKAVFKKYVRNVSIVISIVLLVIAALLYFSYSNLLLTGIVWLISFACVVFSVNGLSTFLEKQKAYLHPEHPRVQIYNKGILISRLYFIPYNTKYIWLRNLEIKKKYNVSCLAFDINIRSGEHPEANRKTVYIAIPKEKEGEAALLLKRLSYRR